MLKGSEGQMKWVYEVNMWTNPILLISIWKVLVIAAMAPAILVGFLGFEEGFMVGLVSFFKVAGLTVGALTALMLIAYPIVTVINGGKYCVVFEMDALGVKHTQMEKQFKKNQAMAFLTVMMGVVAGSPQTAGAGLLAASKKSSYTKFSKVKTVTIHSKRHVIYLNETFNRNQVYADSEDFEVICEHILNQCKKATVVYKSR